MLDKKDQEISPSGLLRITTKGHNGILGWKSRIYSDEAMKSGLALGTKSSGSNFGLLVSPSRSTSSSTNNGGL